MTFHNDDTLTDTEITLLHELKRRGTVELNSDNQTEFWERMDRMGFARMTTSAVVGFERVQGKFVSISDAGKAYLRLI